MGTLRPWDFLSGREEGRKTRESVGRRLFEKEKQGEWTYFFAPPPPGASLGLLHSHTCWDASLAPRTRWPEPSPATHTDGSQRGPGVWLW